ncbi:MAG: hypothetical protein A2020_13200 [Lentisphaerae bacterium GWF2_45_14]|nr:MAG: hypothetical protein A2020_13200 [Lentisphaerae bacterium GWF2_45_14]
MQNTKYKNKVLKGVRSHIDGHVSEIMERFFFERINSPEARNVIYREAEDAFKNQLDDASGVHGIWQGEFWGKWIIGAVQVSEYSQNEELREFIHNAALKLITYQKPDGYLGTYRDSLMVFPADREKTEAILGTPSNWNWNIWCRKYTLWGLLEAWRVTSDSEILQAAVRLADHLIKQLHDNHIRLADTGTFAGLPSCSILKPIIMLYEATGNSSYLKFAQEIAGDWMREDEKIPNIIANALKGIPVHEWYPDTPQWAKVYEMLSCFEGILALYKITADEKLLEACVKFHAMLRKNEFNVLFSVGFNDIFAHASEQLNAISEVCDIIHWMRFCYELFSLTGNKSYMDDFELAFYNPFLAGVYRDGKWGSRGVRGCGHHLTALEQAKFTHNHCCVNNIPRGFMDMSQAMTMFSEDAIYINLYVEFNSDFTINAGRINLSVSGDYLSTGFAKLTFRAELQHPVKLKLRIPGWATSSSLTTAGKRFDGNNADWFEIMLDSGHTEMQLQFDRKLEIREHISPARISDWYLIRWKSGDDAMKEIFLTERASTLVYGPLLLARSKYIGNGEEEMFGSPLPMGFSCNLKVAESKEVWYAFEAKITSGNKCFQTMLCDYASAGNEKLLDDSRFFSIYF